jgi:hypothetical protein
VELEEPGFLGAEAEDGRDELDLVPVKTTYVFGAREVEILGDFGGAGADGGIIC